MATQTNSKAAAAATPPAPSDNQSSSQDPMTTMEAWIAAGMTVDQIKAKVTELQANKAKADRVSSHPAPVTIAKSDFDSTVAYLFKPYQPESGDQNIDRYCQDVVEAAKTGDGSKLLFALADMFRAVWSNIPHLGPIEGALK